ncbi:Uncharacterized protein APZ42_013852 [Daphnia magna]|uniref:Reverse transcriptase domain-containing protein n=1 Tax=Daphnia magna TaxID=35525 RepID=A0A162QH36_9CRUS|nr:Uncharacterized protein APZ42_013852 [Daphnia magna]
MVATRSGLNMDEEQMVGALITLLGSEGLKIFDTFVFPPSGDARKIEPVLDKFTAYFEPRGSEMSSRQAPNPAAKVHAVEGETQGVGDVESGGMAMALPGSDEKDYDVSHALTLSGNGSEWRQQVTVDGINIDFKLNSGAICANRVDPVVCAASRLPFQLEDHVFKKLDKLFKIDILTPVHEPTEWVSRMMVVGKPDGDVRICLNPFELNKTIQHQHFAVPTIEQLFSKLSKTRYFCSLDAASGFYQIPLSDVASFLCTMATPKGRYHFLRLPFGLKSAPEIYLKTMTDLFGDLPGVLIYFDDFHVTGEAFEWHKNYTEEESDDLNYQDWKGDLITRFQETFGLATLEKKLSKLTKKPDENCRAFVSRLNNLYDTIDEATDDKELQMSAAIAGTTGKTINTNPDVIENIPDATLQDIQEVQLEQRKAITTTMNSPIFGGALKKNHGSGIIIRDMIAWGLLKNGQHQSKKCVTHHGINKQLTMEDSDTEWTKCQDELKTFITSNDALELPWLCHVIGQGTLKPGHLKISVIVEMPDPNCPADLPHLLGMVTYLDKFCQNLAGLTRPLRDLLEADPAWVWEEPQQIALCQLKSALSSLTVLRLVDHSLSLVVSLMRLKKRAVGGPVWAYAFSAVRVWSCAMNSMPTVCGYIPTSASRLPPALSWHPPGPPTRTVNGQVTQVSGGRFSTVNNAAASTGGCQLFFRPGNSCEDAFRTGPGRPAVFGPVTPLGVPFGGRRASSPWLDSLWPPLPQAVGARRSVGVCTAAEHTIKTRDARPIRQLPYWKRLERKDSSGNTVPGNGESRRNREVKQSLRSTVVFGDVQQRHECGEGGDTMKTQQALVVLVQKKDGTWWFCVNYKILNAVTINDAHPLPRIEETLVRLDGVVFFSMMDLQAGFWKVPTKERDRPKTAFVTADHLAMHRLPGQYHSILANPGRTCRENQGGTQPVTRGKLEGKETFSIGEGGGRKFNAMKMGLGEATQLAYHDINKQFEIPDACNYGIWVALVQKGEDGERPVAFASRLMNSAKNYSITKKYCHALIFTEEVMQLIDVVYRATTPYHPKAKGMVERLNPTLRHAIDVNK